MKEMRFATERTKDKDGRDTVELPINGEAYLAYRPSTNIIALFYAAQGKKNVATALAGILDFLQRTLEPEAYAIILKAVEEDALEFGELIELAHDIIAEFAENPTGSSADSSSSRASTGGASTASLRRPASTRVPSRSRASSD
jgi:hypothetical protein